MTRPVSQRNEIQVRPVQHRDLELINRLSQEEYGDTISYSIAPDRWFQTLQPWNRIRRVFNLLLNPLKQLPFAYLAEQQGSVLGVIRVAPFNRTRTTWRVDRVAVGEPQENEPEAPAASSSEPIAVVAATPADIGSQLLRYCLETIWDARTWLAEVAVTDNDLLALYRQTGFQPLAQITYWDIAPTLLQELAEREPDLPNLLPVSNADAALLHQLDTYSMPPLVRQVFDRHVDDFKTSLLRSILDGVTHWLVRSEAVSGYVFESQRKAAIGYFRIWLCRDGSRPHQATLTVHPAYTWLYPELMAQLARLTQTVPAQSLQITSPDYQPEREEYLDRIGAARIAHTLLMSRSVWHKLREFKFVSLEGSPLSEVLQGLQPVRKPVPGRITLLRSMKMDLTNSAKPKSQSGGQRTAGPKRFYSRILPFPAQGSCSNLPPKDPCC